MCQVKLNSTYKLNSPLKISFSYEPEMHPGATVRLPDKAVLKVFTTGSVTLTGKYLFLKDGNFLFFY
jgi:TATA-box binding protein (TBP) (component of TFIID and TFIIIB)